MVDGDEAGGVGSLLARYLELDVPYPPQLALCIEEVDEAAADAAHRRDLELARPHRLTERLIEQQRRPVEGGRGIVHREADCAHRGTVRDVEGVSESFLLEIDDEVDRALQPSRHGL